MTPNLAAKLIWLLLFALAAAALTSLLMPDVTDGQLVMRVTLPFFVGGLAGMWLSRM